MSNNNFYKYNFLTNKAFEYQSKILSGKTMTFTRVEIGDGVIGEDQNLEDITSLKNKICDVKILSVVPKGHTVELTILLDGEGLEEVTLYREIGIYAQIDEEEALYAYLNSDDKFDYIIPLNEGNQREFTNNKIKINLVVGNAENIEVTLNNTTIPDDSITMDMLNVEVKNYIEDIKNTMKSDLNEHISKNILDEEGSHGIKYDTSTNTLKYKNNDDWEIIPTGQNAERELTNHKNIKMLDANGVHGFSVNQSDRQIYYKDNGGQWQRYIPSHTTNSILSSEGVHNLRYDKGSNRFKYKESDSWHDIDTGDGVRDELNTHKEKRVSDSEGVHGIRFVEEEDTLKITKQDGQVANYKAGVDPDLLFSDLNTGLDSCMEKVGRTNE